MGVFEQYTRPLNDKEVKLLKKKAEDVAKEAERLPGAFLRSTLLVFGLLTILTLVAARDIYWAFVLFFWLLIGTGIGLWAAASANKKIRKRLQSIVRALDQNEANVTHIQSDQVVQLEEYEDLGANYAFGIDDDTIVIVTGQEFYPSSKFPNSDFSIIEIRDDADKLVEFSIEKHGQKLKPAHTIRKWWTRNIQSPKHLQVLRGKLEDIEDLLTV